MQSSRTFRDECCTYLEGEAESSGRDGSEAGALLSSLPLREGKGVGQGHLKRQATHITIELTASATKAPLQITLRRLRGLSFQSQQEHRIT